MSDLPDKGTATVRRFDVPHQNALLAVGRFQDLFTEFLAHARRWDAPLDDLSYVMARQGLAGAALQLSFHYKGETIGWTLHASEPSLNLFFTGSSADGTVTGRVFTEGVKSFDSSRLYVETKRPGRSPFVSSLDVTGLDVLVMFEQYFRRSEQTPTRFLELSDEEIVMIRGLPDVDRDWIEALDRNEARSILAGSGRPLDERIFRFHCGCTGERIAQALEMFWREKPEELFQGEPGVETLCPRCGARWWIDRDFFEGVRGA